MTDRRLRKTNLALKKSLDSLLSEREFSLISVQDIVNQADIGRATFYRHYTDKYSLLEKLVNEELTLYQRAFHQYVNSQGNVVEVFDQLSVFLKHISIYRNIKDDYINVNEIIKSRLAETYIQELELKGIVIKKETAQVVAAAILEMMDIFIKNNTTISEQVITANARDIIKVLGLTLK